MRSTFARYRNGPFQIYTSDLTGFKHKPLGRGFKTMTNQQESETWYGSRCGTIRALVAIFTLLLQSARSGANERITHKLAWRHTVGYEEDVFKYACTAPPARSAEAVRKAAR